MTRNIRNFAAAGLALAVAGASGVALAGQYGDRTDRQRSVQQATDRAYAADRHDRHDRRDRSERDEHATLKGMRVAVLTGEGLHDMETLAPMAYLSNRGAKVTVIGIERGVVDAYNSDIKVRIEKSVEDVAVGDFDALVLPGGRAPDNIRQHEGVVRFAGDFFRTGKPVAAICHGPQVLVTAGVLDGFETTCISSISDEVEDAGARYKDEEVVRDRNLITSRLPDDIPAFVGMIEKVMVETRVAATDRYGG
ncbi:MAG: type 1 glutamine amidotransferase [Phycisphaerales bacterium]|nr:type 1 glutamine amidotransferase [Phycisphaerales bacterium]